MKDRGKKRKKVPLKHLDYHSKTQKKQRGEGGRAKESVRKAPLLKEKTADKKLQRGSEEAEETGRCLHAFYQKYNPSKLQADSKFADTAIKHYKGNVTKLNEALRKQYGQDLESFTKEVRKTTDTEEIETEEPPLGVVNFDDDVPVEEQVVKAIIALNDPSGSTRQAVIKYCYTTWGTDKFGIPAAIQLCASKGKLRQQKQCFFVRGHKVVKKREVDPSKQLLLKDLEVGDGSEAVKGSTVSVSYVGTLVGGHQFDKGKISFTLGEGEVIKGWDRGISGMLVNGTRKLVIGSNFGYGRDGSPPDIPPNATLFFTVKLLGVD
jgi:hypothetical protein